MKVPIPHDWDGNDWFCVEVQWPNSPHYVGILAGFLSQMTRGRFWDEDTGTIKTAQEIGWQVLDRNMPFVSCAGDDDPADPASEVIYVMSGDESEECEMGGCSIPYGALRWNSGKLQFRYCDAWYDVEGTAPIVDPETDDTVIPEEPPEGYYNTTSCAQARGLAVMTYNVVVQAFAQAVGEKTPWEFYNDMNDAFKKIDLSFNDLMNIYFELIPVNLAGLEGETKDIGIIDYLKCAWVPLIPGNKGGITASEYDQLKTVMDSALEQAIPSDYLGFETAMRAIWKFAFKALGAGDANKITYWAQPLPTDDCACPENIIPDDWELWQDTEDWYLEYDFRGAMPLNWILGTDNGDTIITTRGAELDADTVGSDKVALLWEPPINTGAITKFRVEFLMNPTFLAGDPWVGNGLFSYNLFNQQGNIEGSSGDYSLTKESLSMTPTNFFITAELNANPAYDPMAVVFTRIILAGSGDHPLGL